MGAAEGLKVYSETCPHYIALTAHDLTIDVPLVSTSRLIEARTNLLARRTRVVDEGETISTAHANNMKQAHTNYDKCEFDSCERVEEDGLLNGRLNGDNHGVE